MSGTLMPPAADRRPAKIAPRGIVLAVGYLRRSTDRQEQSIPDQRKAVEQYASDNGMRLIHCYVDDAISGTSTVNRKAFQQMVADAQSPSRPFTVVIAYDVKRFGRVDNDEAGYWRHLLRSAGVSVHYATENFAGDGTDDLLRPVKQWQARQESKDLSKVTIRGLLTRSTTGCWMGGAPPYGYDLRYASQSGQFLVRVRYEPDGSRLALDEAGKLVRTLERGSSLAVTRQDRCWLVPGHPDRVKVVQRIYAMYVQEGRGFKAITSQLNGERIPPARDAKWAARCSGQWSLGSVRAILVNPAYAGDVVWNRRTDARFHRIEQGRTVERAVTGRRLEHNDPSSWVTVRDAHEALVTRTTWEAAQVHLSRKPDSIAQRGTNPQQRSKGAWSGARAKFLLSGLITCGRCGSRYEGITQRTRTKDVEGNKNKSYFYACGGAIRRGPTVCSFGQVPRDAIERAVIDAILEQTAPYRKHGGLQRLMRETMARIGSDRRVAVERRAQCQAMLDEINSTVRNLLDNITAVNCSFADVRLGELATEKERLEMELNQIDGALVSESHIQRDVQGWHEFFENMPALLESDDHIARHGAVRRCINSVRLSSDCTLATLDLHLATTSRTLNQLMMGPSTPIAGPLNALHQEPSDPV